MPATPFKPFEKDTDTRKGCRNLPHWEQPGCTYFLTFRLADSLPQSRLKELGEERETWLELHPKPWDGGTAAEYEDRFGRRIQEWLDAGYGSCALSRQPIQDLVVQALRFFEGQSYLLGDFVLMPNHVHVLVTPQVGFSLSSIVHSWKSYTATQANKILSQTGSFWMDENFDHIVRSEAQLRHFQDYIGQNPIKAKLGAGTYFLQQGDTGWKPVTPLEESTGRMPVSPLEESTGRMPVTPLEESTGKMPVTPPSAGRVEKDLLGEMELPDDVLYGIQTARARQNFDVSGRRTFDDLIVALAQVKQACARANASCGLLAAEIAAAIESACNEVIRGEHHDQFVVDALQGGAGTSTHMNLNEVLARRASQILGQPVDPFDHVNLHQSTNDVYPTALRVAAITALRRLEAAIIVLQEAFQDKEREFSSVVKLGRTELRDAVPVTLGREFGAYANALARDRWRVFKCVERLRTVNLGGTAVGTGLTAPRAYIFCVVEKLREVTGHNLARAENLMEATQNQDALVEVSGILRAHAANLVKVARDLRLMSSGPVGGLNEIELPALQPGSSMMPGKVNPVIPEMVTQVAYRVMAHDQEINLVVMSGELELNAFLPLAADALIDSLNLLQRADLIFAERCIRGITAHAEHCRRVMERSREIVTALIPRIGHERAVELAQLMRERSMTIRDAVKEMNLMPEAEVDEWLTAERLCALGSRE